uniref:Leucine rich repeat containing 43 n=1 Tax=Pseudonaja textilis TaxID=8673 RepID=A0A670Z1W7_PSETE
KDTSDKVTVIQSQVGGDGCLPSAATLGIVHVLPFNGFPPSVPPFPQNKSRFPPRLPPRLHGLPAPRPVTLLRRNGLLSPNEETVEALTEFLRCPDSPWALPPDCNPPEQQLRELAVQHPQIVRTGFVCCYFRSLRIVNKGVTEIDVGLLKFPNLEELILTANHISTIPAANLPPGLKVLELCGNEVQSLKDLCTSPPAGLQHLGLGHNSVLYLPIFLLLRPNLVSLDLCYNNFTNLLSLLSTLSTLKKLRVLVLQGNPFALLPGYRGFTIDSLPHLSVFDDVIITPEERHNFLNLILLLDVQLIVTLGKMRGVPNPFNPEDLESSSGSPIVNYSYYVTYEFAKGERKEKAAGKVRSLWNFLILCGFQQVLTSSGELVAEILSRSKNRQIPPLTGPAPIYSLPTKSQLIGWVIIGCPTAVDWDYRKEHLTEDLVSLKAYLLAGTTVSVVQEKVVSWPVIPTLEEKPGKKGKGAKEKAGNKKKKKSLSPELRSDPPIVKILGSFHINLEKLLAGDSVVETVCNFGVQIIERNVTPPSPKDKVNGRKKDSSEGPDQQLGQPLTVEFQMQHIKWDSASSALKMLEALE